jgi:hypothetical protein
MTKPLQGASSRDLIMGVQLTTDGLVFGALGGHHRSVLELDRDGI